MTRRLVLSYLAVTVVVLAVLAVPLGTFFAQRERDRLTADLEQDANVLATFYEDALEQDGPVDPASAERYRQRTGARVVVVDTAGISLVDTDGSTDRDFSTRPEIAQALSGRRASGTRTSETLGTDLLYVAVPVASGGTVHGATRLTIDMSDVSARIRRFWLGLAAIAAVAIAAVASIGWAIARWVTRPMRALEASAARFAAGDLRLDDTRRDAGPPELRRLGTAMDTMAARLDELLAAQRAFTADASHQLRTPLTALRLRLENLQSRVDRHDAAELADALEEIDRLTTLVNDLLRLARADRPQPSVPVDLARLTRERVDTWTAVADEQHVPLTAAGVDRPVVVHASPGALEQVLDNLLDNAIHASPSGAPVTVQLTITPAGVILEVIDHGPGLDDRAKVLARQRFWRADPSRPGTGLGLAIVERLAAGAGGHLHLLDTTQGGLTARITLPHHPAVPAPPADQNAPDHESPRSVAAPMCATSAGPRPTVGREAERSG
jgi:signal transduction histidine kinase